MNTLRAFLARAQMQPDAPAVDTLSYGALADAALRLGASLRAEGVGAEDIVAVSLPRSPELVIALLGTWAAGGAFTILDRELPPARRDHLLERVRASGRLAAVLESTAQVSERLEHAPVAPATLDPEQLAYLCWSSGSTGEPKGVLIEHHGLLPMLVQQIAAFDLRGPGDLSLWMLRSGFDASLSDIFTALVAGAELRIAPTGPRALELLHSRAGAGITHVDLPPALLPHLDLERLPASLRTLVVGGEVAPAEAVRALASSYRIAIVYGPAEATICTSFCIAGADWERPLIGRPHAGVRYAVEPESGELVIFGPQVGRGYLGAPALTQTRFVDGPDGRGFRSGDRIQRELDGEYRYVGRVDRQLKIAGQLVAPEEVEAALVDTQAVTRAHVAQGDETGRLHAWVEAPAPGFDADALRGALAERFGAWMVPGAITRLDHLPTGPSGKVDAAALRRQAKHEAPTGSHAVLAVLAARILGVAQVELDRSFPEQGGDSLAALELAAGMAALGVDLGPSQIDDLNTRLRDLVGEEPRDIAVEVAPARPLAKPIEVVPLRRVLVLGANGFLGSHVVAALHEAGVGEIYASARCRGGRSAAGRIREALAAGVATPECLDLESGDSLPDALDAVFNCTGRANSAASFPSLCADNVGPLEALLESLGDAPCAVHHASSLSVVLPRELPAGALLEQPVVRSAGLSAYAVSKALAEKRLLDGPAQGNVYRFGLLTGGTGTLLDQLLVGLARIGAVPADWFERLEMDITPIDFAARAMVALAQHGPAPAIFHVAGAAPVTLGDWVRALEAEGHPIERLEGEGATADLEARAARHGLPGAAALLALCRGFGGARFEAQHGLDMFEATGARFDCRGAEAVLSPLGIERPRADGNLLRAYVRQAMARERMRR